MAHDPRISIKRNIFKYLTDWRDQVIRNPGSRKPLVVRGARQVGKTFAIEAFGRQHFAQMIKLNLDKDEDRALFSKVQNAEQFIRTLELRVKAEITPGQTLLFIDEIQNSAVALKQLRYFYEELPGLHVIAAGSLLDVFINRHKLEMPVGRVEYCYMHPLGFDEFLDATGNTRLLELIRTTYKPDQIEDAAHELCNKAFLEYILIGGMPQAVASYVAGETPHGLERIYESLMVGYRDDIGKYATSAQSVYLRHCLENAPRSVGMQIAYNHFADSDFGSREISAAFDTLEFAQLVTRVFSSRSLAQPLVQNRRKAPKILFLDVGLVNYKLGQREKILSLTHLENVFQGQVSEQVVGQTLRYLGESTEQRLCYWYRDKKGSNAEVDYLLSFKDQIIPVEVKAGSSQKIQSLHTFIDERAKLALGSKQVAIRVHSGKFVESVLRSRGGNEFLLISVPYYLLFRIQEIIAGRV